MLAGFRSWLRRRETTRRRLIFQFVAAGQTRAADPIVVFRSLELNGGEGWPSLLTLVAMLCKPPTADEKLLLTTDKDHADRAKRQIEAIYKLADLARISFDLKKLESDGSGVTEEEAIAILSDFVVYTEGLAEKARPFQ